MSLRSPWFLVVWSLALLRLASSSFLEQYPLHVTNSSSYKLAPFVIYAALDVDRKLVKFLINTQVQDRSNMSTTGAIITDVDSQTNRYTTLHVEVDFVGKQFVSQNLRFCDVLAVKNTSEFGDSARYDSSDSSSATTASSSFISLTSSNTYSPHSPEGRPLDGIVANSTVEDTEMLSVRSLIPSKSNNTRDETLSTSNATIEALFSNDTGSLVQCPLYQNDSIVIYYEVDVSKNFRELGSYSVKFTVVSNDEDSNIIGGAYSYFTSTAEPVGLVDFVFFGILTLVIVSYVVNFFIIMLSPNQESRNPFLVEASAICNKGLLRQVQSSVYCIISYLQYALFLGALDGQYPGFFQYLMGKFRWCALLSINVFHNLTSIPSSQIDNICITYMNGLAGLASYNSNGFMHYSWPNFIICFLIWVAAGMFFYQALIILKTLASNTILASKVRKVLRRNDVGDFPNESDKIKPATFTYSSVVNLWALLGFFLREFLTTFGLPILVLTFFMLSTASNMNGVGRNVRQSPSPDVAFSDDTPYEMLFPFMFHPPPNSTVLSNSTEASHLIDSRGSSVSSIPTLSIVFGSITVALWCGSSFFFLYYYIFPYSVSGKPKRNVTKLYTSVRTIVTWAYLYNQYKPSKVYFVSFDIVSCLLSSIVIAVLQENGAVQVSILIIIEFVKWLLLVSIKPYFLGFSWHSLPFLMQSTRVVITVLCIVYLEELGSSETTKSYVAYAQLVIHIVISFVFVIHLLYCLFLTIKASLSGKSSRTVVASTDGKSSSDSYDVSPNESVTNFVLHRSHLSRPDLKRPDSLHSSIGDGEFEYYRSKSEKRLLTMNSPKSEESLHGKAAKQADDNSSFIFNQGESSDAFPMVQKDYTKREADRLYQNYFYGEEIDPEMKELWATRDWKVSGQKNASPKKYNSKSSETFFSSFSSLFKKPEQKGFEVLNRRPLKIKARPIPDATENETES